MQQKYDAYISRTEARIDREAHSAAFLWSTQSPDRLQRVRRGEVVTEPGSATGDSDVGHGLILDWIGAIYVPSTPLARVVAFLGDYDSHKRFFRPEVVGSRLIGRDGDTRRIRYRIVKRYILTVVVDTDQTAIYQSLGDKRMMTRSYATRIVEVKNAGRPGERELDPRRDRPMVWRLNTYWRLEEKDGGVYIECQTISLTRAAPPGLGWLITPIVRSLPRDSLVHLLESTRNGALGRNP